MSTSGERGTSGERSTETARRGLIAPIIVGLVGLQFLVVGVFALAAPEAFFDTLATFEPYNRHFIHDLGAFQIGIGAALLAAAARLDGLLVGLIGGTTTAVLHLFAHVIDRDLGGTPATDIPFFGFITAALLVALWAHLRTRTPRGR